jgi:ABC-type lipoprotein export system ATPase subunit
MLTLNHVLPTPLQGQVRSNSQIWQCEQHFQKGFFYLVSAASGKGKTTLQHLLYGLRQDYSGEIKIKINNNSLIINELKTNDWAEVRSKNLSVIFQDLRLFAELTVGENLFLKNQLTDFKTEIEIKNLLAQLEMDTFWDKKTALLSYGQRQRVAIVRALLQPFDFLLMDEPFAHLDTENIKKACELITQHCKIQKAGAMLCSLGDKYFFNYDFELHL